jgi:prepilin-type N-terminal cleavage/methylation domain-containing protein
MRSRSSSIQHFPFPIPRSPFRRRHAFTLIELLMVIVIMMLAAAMAVPSFIRSYRGAKLRASARAVVMSHRYARGMAVLKQVHVAALFDAKKNTIEIVSVTDESAVRHHDKVFEERDKQAAEEAGATPGEEIKPAVQASGVVQELVRPLADGVKIARFESEKVEQEKDGIYWVNYYRNGMCDPYSIELRDEHNRSATLTVDPLSGKAKVEYD